jgi:two-component system NtrC family sensor kinase
MELPVTPAEPMLAPAPGAAPPTTRLDGVRLLLVEDEKALANATSEALAHEGLVVDIAGDGEEALARVRQKQYDVVVCDLKMPRVSGMMLYRAIAAGAPALARRVIFVTGDVAATEAERFLADSGCRWLVKPFRIGDLLRAVRDTLA